MRKAQKEEIIKQMKQLKSEGKKIIKYEIVPKDRQSHPPLRKATSELGHMIAHYNKHHEEYI